MRIRTPAALLTVTALAVGSLMSAGAFARPPSKPQQAKPPIAGRWEVQRTCGGLVQAAQKAHLGRLAPAIVGEYFPGKTPRQLARKHPLCRGAKPQRHSHFFTRNGIFGSLDQNEQQVDDGTYRIVDSRTVHIGNPDVAANFHYRVDQEQGGKVLLLQPVITKRMRRQALAHPFGFSPAGWAVAVAYAGHPWEEVPCRKWC